MPGKPIGYQLTCYKGTWYDENNATAQTDGQGKYPGTCEPGCVGLSRTEQIFTTIINAPSNTGVRRFIFNINGGIYRIRMTTLLSILLEHKSPLLVMTVRIFYINLGNI